MNSASAPAQTSNLRRLRWANAAVAFGAAGMFFAIRPELGVLSIVAILGGLLIFNHLEMALPVGMFLAYVNLPVIAGAYGIPRSIAGVATFGVLAIPVAQRILQREPIRVVSTTKYLVGFALVQFLGAVLLAPDPVESFEVVTTTLTEGLILFMIVTNAIETRRRLRMSLWAITLAGGIMGGVPMHQYATGNVLNDYGGLATMDKTDLAHARERGIDLSDKRQYGGRIRLAGSIGEKNRFAQVLVMVLPMCGALAILEKGALRYAAIGLAILAVGGIVVTFSRGAIVGVGGALFAAALLKVIRWRDLLVAGIIASVVVLCQPGFRSRIVALGAYAGLPVVRTPDAEEETSVQGRLNEMVTAFKVFLANPVIGVGPGMFGRYYEQMAGFQAGKQHAGARRSHNLLLNIAAEHGVLGLLTFGAFVGLTLRDLYLSRLHALKTFDWEMAAICGAMVIVVLSYLGTGMFLHFAYVRYFWLVMGVAAACAVLCDEKRREDAMERSSVTS